MEKIIEETKSEVTHTGRKPRTLTDEERRTVQKMASFGIPQSEIARHLCMSLKTLSLKKISVLALLCAGSMFAQIWGDQPSVIVDSSLITWYSLSPYYNNPAHVLNVTSATINFTGLTMYDYSGNGNNGTYSGLSGGTYYGTYGSYPSFARFGLSTSGYVAIPSLTIPARITVSAWAATSAAMSGSYARIVELGSSDGGLYLGGNSTNTQYQVSVGNYATSYGSCEGGTIDANWHLVTATYDGTNANLYVDGALVAGPCAFTLGTPTLTTGTIGCSNGSTPCSSQSQAWGSSSIEGGFLGDVRINNRLIAASEMLQIYSSESQGFDLPAPPAQAAGYHLAFSDNFASLNIGSNGTGTYVWYPGIWFQSAQSIGGPITGGQSGLGLEWDRSSSQFSTSIEGCSYNGTNCNTFRYGYFEARMKWDVTTGAWPAFWMITKQALAGSQDVGELDIFEGQGADPNHFYGTINEWKNGALFSTNAPEFPGVSVAGLTNQFLINGQNDFSIWHTYGVLWVPGTVTWYFDDKPIGTAPAPAVFDSEDFYIILGSQEGAGWTYSNLTGVTAQSLDLDVEWVHVFQP